MILKHFCPFEQIYSLKQKKKNIGANKTVFIHYDQICFAIVYINEIMTPQEIHIMTYY